VSDAARPWLRWIADAPWVIAGLAALGLLLYTAAGRYDYPYDIEWMEGGLLTHAWRVREGLPLYVEPSVDFVPFIYPPLYAWVLGTLGHVFELGYPLGRLLSLAGSLAAAGALVAAVRVEGGRWAVGLGAAGLFLSTYEDGGTFFDLVRIDGLFVGLMGWALVAMRAGWVRAGGLLLTAAYATKHNAAAFGLVPLVWLWVSAGRATALRFAAWSLIPALLFTGGMMMEGDGLFLTYILGVPATHGINGGRAFPQSQIELWQAMPWPLTLALLGGLWAVVKDARQGQAPNLPAAYWIGQAVVVLILCALMRGHTGGFVNVLIPGFWMGAAAVGLLATGLSRRGPAPLILGLFGLLVAAQVWLDRWEVSQHTPTAKDRAAGAAVVEAIAGLEGRVLAPWFPWYAVLAGKEPGLHLIGLWDIDRPTSPFGDRRKLLAEAIASQQFEAVVCAQGDLKFGFKEHYELRQTLPVTGKAMQTRTGWRVVPRGIWVPKRKGP
jgi:hypothetical protein